MVRKSSTAYVPERGDVVWLDFDPQAGHEQAGRRPALVLSPRVYYRPSGLVSGVILADQLKSLAWKQRKADYLCEMPLEVLEDILEKLLTLIDPLADEDSTP